MMPCLVIVRATSFEKSVHSIASPSYYVTTGNVVIGVTSLLCDTTTDNAWRSSNPDQSQTPTLDSSTDPTTATAVPPFPSLDPLSVNRAQSYSSA
jgi:hypothetical protein